MMGGLVSRTASDLLDRVRRRSASRSSLALHFGIWYATAARATQAHTQPLGISAPPGSATPRSRMPWTRSLVRRSREVPLAPRSRVPSPRVRRAQGGMVRRPWTRTPDPPRWHAWVMGHEPSNATTRSSCMATPNVLSAAATAATAPTSADVVSAIVITTTAPGLHTRSRCLSWRRPCTVHESRDIATSSTSMEALQPAQGRWGQLQSIRQRAYLSPVHQDGMGAGAAPRCIGVVDKLLECPEGRILRKLRERPTLHGLSGLGHDSPDL